MVPAFFNMGNRIGQGKGGIYRFVLHTHGCYRAGFIQKYNVLTVPAGKVVHNAGRMIDPPGFQILVRRQIGIACFYQDPYGFIDDRTVVGIIRQSLKRGFQSVQTIAGFKGIQ